MDIYAANIRKYENAISALRESSNALSVNRLLVFLFSAIIVIILASQGLVALMMVVVMISVAAFAGLVKRHNGIDDLQRQAILLKEINEKEVLRQDNKLSGFPTGESFSNPRHQYVSDLDVFGQHSLFQLINRTTTEPGNTMLAEWLSAPAVKDVILERQDAVKELTPRLEWRQAFQESGMRFSYKPNDYEKLLTWMTKPVRLIPSKSNYLLAIVPLSILSTVALVYFFYQFFVLLNFKSVLPLIIVSLANSRLLKKMRPVAEDITGNLVENVKILAGYESLIRKIESEKFNSSILGRLQSALAGDRYSAANEIHSLRKTWEVFQVRGRRRELNNFFYSAFNVLWFLDFYLIILTEQWKQKNGSSLRLWAAAVSEFEVLSSLAGFHFSNPAFTFPEISNEAYYIDFEMLGHPLISRQKRVCNDFRLVSRGEIAMITGSNMAGKSTFLRTVGVNLVLGLMGAPCCAKSAQISNLKVFSSMRTQDNLEEGVSSFYAELKRVEQLLRLVESGEAIFFLLDEMFKGTNSKDRHQGGFSLIRQLQGLNAFGIISTHDLDLADFTGKNSIVNNYSFNSDIQGNDMIFDYKLSLGLCKDFNASELMKRSGIKILPIVD